MQYCKDLLVFLALAFLLCTVISLPLEINREAVSLGIRSRDPGITVERRAPEVLNIMGHSHTGEITRDVSHYFHQVTPTQRLRLHLNGSKALTDPTLEQIMISDHPPFIKRNEDPGLNILAGLTNLRAATTVDHVGFADYDCAVSQAMRHRLKRGFEAFVGAWHGKSAIIPKFRQQHALAMPIDSDPSNGH